MRACICNDVDLLKYLPLCFLFPLLIINGGSPSPKFRLLESAYSFSFLGSCSAFSVHGPWYWSEIGEIKSSWWRHRFSACHLKSCWNTSDFVSTWQTESPFHSMSGDDLFARFYHLHFFPYSWVPLGRSFLCSDQFSLFCGLCLFTYLFEKERKIY